MPAGLSVVILEAKKPQSQAYSSWIPMPERRHHGLRFFRGKHALQGNEAVPSAPPVPDAPGYSEEALF